MVSFFNSIRKYGILLCVCFDYGDENIEVGRFKELRRGLNCGFYI